MTNHFQCEKSLLRILNKVPWKLLSVLVLSCLCPTFNIVRDIRYLGMHLWYSQFHENEQRIKSCVGLLTYVLEFVLSFANSKKIRVVLEITAIFLCFTSLHGANFVQQSCALLTWSLHMNERHQIYYISQHIIDSIKIGIKRKQGRMSNIWLRRKME